MSQNALTPIGILYFPALFTAKGNRQNPAQEHRFSTVLLFDELATQTTAYKDMKLAALAAVAAKWGDAKAADVPFLKSLRMPFRPADEKQYGGFEDGKIFISPWRSGKDGAPGVVDLRGTVISVPSDVWGGQLARATVRAFAYDNNGNKGVSFILEHVQLVKADMPRRDGQQSASEAFGSAGGIDAAQAAALGIGVTPTTSHDDSDDLPF